MNRVNTEEDNLISVIVPVYNVKVYLRRCIESIIAQTYENMQIILVDDGSTDGSAAICDEYRCQDDRIEVIHKKNGGLVSARKAGLDVAEGKYIGFVDGDDYIDAEFYAEMVKAIVEYDVDFAHTALCKEYNTQSEYSGLYEGGVHHIEGSQIEYIIEYMLNSDSVHYMDYGVVLKLFKADLIKSCYANVPDAQSLGEDLLAVCRCLLESKKIYMDTQARYHYFIRETSISHHCDFDSLIKQANLYTHLLKVFEDYGVVGKIKKQIEKFFQNRYITYFANMSKERNIHVYSFPAVSKIRGKRIVIYGAGKVGQDYYAQLSRYRDIHISAWADKNSKGHTFDYADIIGKEDAAHTKADYFVIAVLKAEKAQEIERELVNMGVDSEKIIWEKPKRCDLL